MPFAGNLCWRAAGFVLSIHAKFGEKRRWFSQKPERSTSPALRERTSGGLERGRPLTGAAHLCSRKRERLKAAAVAIGKLPPKSLKIPKLMLVL